MKGSAWVDRHETLTGIVEDVLSRTPAEHTDAQDSATDTDTGADTFDAAEIASAARRRL